MKDLTDKLRILKTLSSENIKEEIHHLVEAKGLRLGQSYDATSDYALVGELKGPDVPDISRNPWKD